LHPYIIQTDVEAKPSISASEDPSTAAPTKDGDYVQYNHAPSISEGEDMDDIEHLVDAMSLQPSPISDKALSVSSSIYSVSTGSPPEAVKSPSPPSTSPQQIVTRTLASAEIETSIAAPHIRHSFNDSSFVPIRPTDLPSFLSPCLAIERAELANIICRHYSMLKDSVHSTWRPRNVHRERKLKFRRALQAEGEGFDGALRRMKRRVEWLGMYEGRKLRKSRELGECIWTDLDCGGDVDMQGEDVSRYEVEV
jgi:hypothetical protein